MSHIPPVDPETTSYGVVLWLCSIVLGVVANTMPACGPYWIDTVFTAIGKLAPLVSTFFLYIINKKTIDKYFETISKKFKK